MNGAILLNQGVKLSCPDCNGTLFELAQGFEIMVKVMAGDSFAVNFTETKNFSATCMNKECARPITNKDYSDFAKTQVPK